MKIFNSGMRFNKRYLELFLYTIFSNVYINLVGVISISEIWVLAISPFIIRTSLFKKYPLLRRFAMLFVFYIVIQLFSELITGTEIMNLARGLMVTIVSLLTTIYLFVRFIKDPHLSVYFFCFIFIRKLVFINSADLGFNEVSFDYEALSFFKFKLAPLITSFIVGISYFLLKKGHKRLVILMIIGAILFYVTSSARSASLGLFLTLLLFLSGKLLVKHKKYIASIGISLVGLSYLIFVFWIGFQLKGDMRMRNNQVDNLENPYNPIETLQQGRSEFFVGLVAFQDKFLWGHGAWALDNEAYYENMIYQIKNTSKKNTKSNTLVPSHSVLIGTGVNYGIFTFIAIVMVWFLMIRIGIKIFPFYIRSNYAIIYLMQLFSVFWTMLFSPIAHLRTGLPITFALMLVMYYWRVEYFKEKKKLESSLQ